MRLQIRRWAPSELVMPPFGFQRQPQETTNTKPELSVVSKLLPFWPESITASCECRSRFDVGTQLENTDLPKAPVSTKRIVPRPNQPYSYSSRGAIVQRMKRRRFGRD